MQHDLLELENFLIFINVDFSGFVLAPNRSLEKSDMKLIHFQKEYDQKNINLRKLQGKMVKREGTGYLWAS